MTFIRKLALALSLAGCFSFSNAQTVDSTGNLITNVRGTSGHDVWLGTGGNSQLGGQHPTDLWGCCTSYSGSSPFFDTSTTNGNGDSGQIIWSYGNATVNYIVNTANALAGVGNTGLQVHGYTWGYDVRNMNGTAGTGQSGIDTLTATSRLWNSTYTGGGLASQTRTHNTMMDWTRFSSTVTLSTPQSLSNVGNLQLSFSASDSGFWGGYYGPQIRDVRASLLYSVDPCVANPLYASHCAGFNDIVLSGNLVPNPDGYATWGQSLNQTFAMSTALQHGGMGVKVHGFQWGYDVFVGNPYYAGALWTDWRDPNVDTYVNITNSAGTSLYYANRKAQYDDKEYWSTYNYSYTLPQTINSLNLGNFGFVAYTHDYAGITNMYARIQYTPDQCVLNPLFSTACTGYQQAFYDQQCSLNPLYNNQCPGYAEAYYSQQCSLNALYDSGCPGYETAYFNFQCSQSALYNQSCPGYAQAYFDQQCSLSPLYNQSCPGYQQAYFDQQCSLSALYNQSCPGYAQAYFDQQCGLDPFYDNQCPGYGAALALQSLQQQTSSQTNTPQTSSISTSSVTVALADPTRTETVITTDIGGVELTTTGEISVPTGEPTAVKEAVKESAKEETKKEEDKKEQAEKKRVDPRALAVARAAAREAEATALSTADQAVAFSQSDLATSTALGLGTGITVGGFRPLGVGDGQEEEGKTAQGLSSNRDANINLQNNTAQQGQQQDAATKSGPAVRNGGRVEGMEGGPDPAQLARAPMDFNQYLNAQLKDAQFYSSKEIYKGQRNVDNQRLLRGLTGGSDLLHQQMVDQQYNITGQ